MHFQLTVGLSRHNPVVSQGRSVDQKGLVFLFYCLKETSSENFSSEERWLLVFPSLSPTLLSVSCAQELIVLNPSWSPRPALFPTPVNSIFIADSWGWGDFALLMFAEEVLPWRKICWVSQLRGILFITEWTVNSFTSFGVFTLYCDFPLSWGCSGEGGKSLFPLYPS